MHDLRKKALLESRKTVSRKARSAEGTPPSSRAMSRTNSATASSRGGSRVASRAGSDAGSDSDSTEWSIDGIDSLESDGAPGVWVEYLYQRIDALVDRKRSSTEGRESMMKGLNSILTRHFAQDEVKTKIGELLPALLKSVKAGQSEQEIVLALRGLALVLITVPNEKTYDEIQGAIKTTINESEHSAAKVAAIHALGVVTFYGGASIEETVDVMDFYLDIASSDGAVIDETDNAAVVVAALQEWGFLATLVEDMEELTEPAMETFFDQLDSTDIGVQGAAGENIALIFEKSYTEVEEDDEVESDSEEAKTGLVQRYTVYRRIDQLQQKLEDLTKFSSKHVSKKNLKQLHVQCRDILTAIDKPGRGPRYSTAMDPEGREYGSRMKMRVLGGGMITVDTWWKLHRINGLKRLLRAGFIVHYEFNETVFDSLPVIVEYDRDE